MRVLGFILVATLSLANLVRVPMNVHKIVDSLMNKILQTLDRRLPPVNAAGGLFNIRAFKALPYSTYTAAGFLSFLGLYTGTSDI